MTMLTKDVMRILARLRSETEAASRTEAADMIEALHQRLDDAEAAQALVVEQAAAAFPDDIEVYRLIKKSGESKHGAMARIVGDHLQKIANAIRALAPASGVEALADLRAERDRFEAALGRACLVGGTTYLVERAEKAEADRDRLAAANAALEAQVARLVDAGKAAATELRVIAGMDMIGASAVAWNAARALEAALAAVQADARRDGEGGE